MPGEHTENRQLTTGDITSTIITADGEVLSDSREWRRNKKWNG